MDSQIDQLEPILVVNHYHNWSRKLLSTDCFFPLNLSIMQSSPVLIAFQIHINSNKMNKMYLKLAKKPFFTIL